MLGDNTLKKIMILGPGPHTVGQAAEYDCFVAQALAFIGSAADREVA